MKVITKEKQQKSKSISTKLSISELAQITKIVDSGAFLNPSDFVRSAIREKLEYYKIINVKDVDYDTAKKEILGYYKTNKEAYISDVANDLEFDLELVANITDELVKEKRLEDIEV